MRFASLPALLVVAELVLGTNLIESHLANMALAEEREAAPKPKTTGPPDARLAPYDADPKHPWNRLHQGLFVREAPDGSRHVHSTDPFLYRGGEFLHEEVSHRRAIALLDEFLAKSGERMIDDPLKRLYLQRDLWAAFDYAAWYPDEWVFKSRFEPAAVALRGRLAKAIGRLSLGEREFLALPDNYALAVKTMKISADHDPEHPERPFLPADLFDPTGPWMRIHVTSVGEIMTRRHFEGAGGRAVHTVYIRLPGGRAATEKYVKELKRDSVEQFPPGTMVAMARRAMAVDATAKVRVTPITELLQIRVYRRIPADLEANLHGDSGVQDVYEFVLDRDKLFAGQHGLRAVGPEEPAEPLFERREGDPFLRDRGPLAPEMPQMKTCIQCHSPPGVYSVLSMTNPRRELRVAGKEPFKTYAWNVELNYSMTAKTRQYNWGLLQGMLEKE